MEENKVSSTNKNINENSSQDSIKMNPELD